MLQSRWSTSGCYGIRSAFFRESLPRVLIRRSDAGILNKVEWYEYIKTKCKSLSRIITENIRQFATQSGIIVGMESGQLRAAEYMRMSTEHQQYSIANQSEAIQQYANAHSIEIIRTYVDRGKSGLAIKGRHGLRDLLQTAECGIADFTLLLVYDVSRWGRFQDVDESAFYEYTLKRAGISVKYCAEPFRDDGSPTDALLKALKRSMAAEFSRELSVKVTEGQRRIARLGYRLGGCAGFGFRRVAIDPAGSRRIVLEAGERKSIKTDRITLVHGPDQEVSAVRDVFDVFVNEGISEATIAKRLNERGTLTRFGNRWHKQSICKMLTNPKYVGDLAFSRTATKMRSPPVNNPRENWVYVPGCFEPIVSRDIWNRAQAIYAKRVTDAEEGQMLGRLRLLLNKHGRLTGPLIDAEEDMLKSQTYRARFGSLLEAYRRVGFGAERRYGVIAMRPQVRSSQRELERAIAGKLSEVADEHSKDPGLPLWQVNGELSIYAAVVPVSRARRRRRVWAFYGNRKRRSDILVLARLDPESAGIMDYFVFASSYELPIHLFDENGQLLEMHRFADLTFLEIIARRIKLNQEAG